MLQIIVVTIIEAKNGGSWVIEREKRRGKGEEEEKGRSKEVIVCLI